ncbi:fibronectin type III domain-containing protein [Demequina sp. NBRC 110054]|uniref:fibronectin type III domain-containing protein n=1 Tax=Demequina sp. NBRC 110054 TaxID=1570343 RepID=UPI000A03F7DD|nr:fibronectin type III domain-containing protein [Demequina sp. NBRC 110054]
MRALSLRAVSATVIAALAVVLVPTAASAATVGGSSPETAVPLPISDFESSFTASNVGIDSTGTYSESEMPYRNNVAWYSVTPDETTTVFIRVTATSPTNFDNTLEVWTSAGAFIDQSDDDYGRDAALVVTLAAGTEYLIGLGAYYATDSQSASWTAHGEVTMTFADQPPSAPGTPSATAGNGSATVSWTAPTDEAGGVTGYRVLCTPDGGSETTCATLSGEPPTTSTTVTGLTNGTAYTFRVEATNMIGYGDPSAASSSVTPQATSTTTLSVDPASPVSGEEFAVTATVASGGSSATGTVDITVDGVTTSGLSLVDGAATVSGLTYDAGDIAVSASYSGSAAVKSSTASRTVTIGKRSQTLTIDALPDGLVYEGDPVTVSASSSEDLPVTLAASGACALSGDELQLTGVGTCTVSATQAGTSEVASATASVDVSVGKRSQALTLGELLATVYGERAAIAATSSVGLDVTLAASGACEIQGGRLVATDVGDCTVTASQAGDELTAAATVARTVTIAKRSQEVTLSALPDLTFGMDPIAVTASSEYDLPTVLAAEGVCEVEDGELVLTGAGDCSVTATAEGDSVTLPGSATATVEVAAPDPDLDLVLEAELGDDAQEATVSATGEGLLPGSTLILEVHSTPQQIGTAVVADNGTATVTGVLPELEAGDHELVAIGTWLDGTDARIVTTFTVSEEGVLTTIEDRTLRTELAATGAEPVGALAIAAAAAILGAGLLLARRRIVPVEG